MPTPLIPQSHLGSGPEPQKRFRLLERVRHYSARTEGTYLDWVRRFVVFHARRHPAYLAEREVAAFLTHLATERKVSSATQNQALAALLFLYRHVLNQPLGFVNGVERAKTPRRLPVCFRRERSEPCCASCAVRRGCALYSCTAADYA